jgi:hypothetical protein
MLGATCWVLSLSPFAPALADEDADETGERCVDTRNISRTEVIDSQHILFYMRDRTIYHNELPYRCSGLRRSSTLSYRTSISRLCSSDIISIVDDHGFGLSRGISCGLGRFDPIAREEARAVRGEHDIEPEPVPPADPEEPAASE